MRKILLLSALAIGALTSVNAQSLSLQKSVTAEKSAVVATPKVLKTKTLDNGIVVQEMKDASGLLYKRIVNAPANKTLNPVRPSASKAGVQPTGTVLFEDFEEWDGTNPDWLPEGWSRDRKVTAKGHQGWQMMEANPQFLASKGLVFPYFDYPVDEWIISPEFTVGNGMTLSWETYSGGVYYFDQSYYNPWGGAFSEVVVINDFKVNVSIDGGLTWETLKSIAEDIAKESDNFWDIYYNYTGFTQFTVDLSKYAGKTVKLGFQVVGDPESQTSTLDNVKVGYPDLDLSYSRPTGSLYFGLNMYDEYVPGTFLTVPVYAPVSFKNSSKDKNATFWWTYEDAAGQTVTAEGKDLAIVYTTNHESEKTSRNNMYNMPVLHGSAQNYAETEVQRPGFIQAGGRAEYEKHYVDTGDSEWLQLGMSVADPNTEGTRTYADITVPYFGYNQDSDRFWSDYTFGAGDWDENSWNHLEKYGNLFYTPDAPIVIEGIRTNAFGQISRNAVFTADIYFLDAAFRIPDSPTYSATCTGEDIYIYDRTQWGYNNNFISLDFKFEEPIVISKAECPYFVVAIGGFRDPENVQYFSPEMSEYDNPSKLGLGWTAHQLCYQGELIPYLSWSTVVNLTERTEPAGYRYISFYIMLDAVYPWLEGEDVELNIGDEPVTIALDSYYNGSELSFEGLPAWLDAKAEGRYDKTYVTFTALGTGVAEVTISAPGVSKTVKISGNSGISAITPESNPGHEQIYTIDGKLVDGKPAPGLYIVRRADGTVAKTVIR